MLIAALLLGQAVSTPPTPDPTRYLLVKPGYTTPQPPTFRAVAPTFPAQLRAAVQVTTVVIEVVVDRHGRISRASIEAGDAKAHEAALRAAIQWMFEPLPKGVPERSVKLSFTFRTLPAWAPPEELVTVFSENREVEVRALVAAQPPKP